MFKQKQWLAVIRGDHWVVAKVARRKLKLDILRLSEFRPEPEDELDHVQEQLGKKAASLKEWLHKNHVPVQKLRIAVSCPGVITRMITLPLMSTQDLDRLLTEQVDQYFTLNISDYVVDYRVLERLLEDGEMRLRVLLAALPKYQWEKLWSGWEDLGFKPKVVDLAADGLARLYSQLAMKGKSEKNTAGLEAPLDIAVIELSTDRAEFILLEHGVVFLYSDVEVALKGLNHVKLALNVNSGERGDGLSESTQDQDQQTLGLQEWAKTKIEMTLGNVLQSLTEFLSFFATRHFGKSIQQIYLTGEYSDLPFLQEIFEKNLGIVTQVGFPNDWHPRYSRRVRMLQKKGMKYGSLYGLALRED